MDIAAAAETGAEDESGRGARDEKDPTSSAAGEPDAKPKMRGEDPKTAPGLESESEEDERLGPGEKLSDEELERSAAALLFASSTPITLGRLQKLLERPSRARVKAILQRLSEHMEASGLPIVLREIAGGWRLLSDPHQADVIARLQKVAKPERISSAALETLAIVAYRQPVTKAEIEAIRGVQSGPILRSLVDRGLARIAGRADQPGSPLQYGTTRDFLERFGLAGLKDLPRDGELNQD